MRGLPYRWLLDSIALLLAAATCHAADLGAPRLSEPLATQRFFDPDRLLTTGGVRYTPGSTFTIEPRFGLGYRAREREQAAGLDEVLHKVHAEAGGRIGLSRGVYFSAAAKLPVYTYEISEPHLAGAFGIQAPVSRHDYELLRLPGSNLSWTSEMGIRLGSRTDLTIYYDQTLFPAFSGAGGLSQPEDRFGTRIIFRFK